MLIDLFVVMKLQEDGARDAERWEGYVDWRNRPATRGRHGGMVAASFVLGNRSIDRLPPSLLLDSFFFFSSVR